MIYKLHDKKGGSTAAHDIKKGVPEMTTHNNYKELREKAINGDQNAVNELGEWFSNYGGRYWNGEYYDADEGFRLYPIYEEVAYWEAGEIEKIIK